MKEREHLSTLVEAGIFAGLTVTTLAINGLRVQVRSRDPLDATATAHDLENRLSGRTGEVAARSDRRNVSFEELQAHINSSADTQPDASTEAA